MAKTFKYKKLHYSVDVNFEDFKKAYPQITQEKFEELTGKKIEVKKPEIKKTEEKIEIKKAEKKEVKIIHNDFEVDLIEKKDVDKTQENIYDK